MNKTFAALVLASTLATAALAACHAKKPAATAPSGDGAANTGASGASIERKGDATGGATYGGRKAGAAKDAPRSPDH